MPPAPPRPHRQAPPGRRRVAVVTLALAAVLTGCGLRLETEPPRPLVPGPVEVVRQRTTADAVALRLLADIPPADAADPVTDVLAGVVEASDAHLAGLGGLYEAGAPSPAPSDLPSAAPAPTEQPTASAGEVLTVLADAAARARSDADEVPDGALARLLASVAVSRRLLAEDLAAAAGLVLVPVDGATAGTLPEGVSTTQAVAVVASEDAAGAAWEVVAARVDGEARATAAERAAHHRRRAEEWAVAAGLDDPGIDPRRPAYDLPDAVLAGTDPAAVTAALADLETSLTETYASLVAASAAGGRTSLVDAALDAARAARDLTGRHPAFPGLPEQG